MILNQTASIQQLEELSFRLYKMEGFRRKRGEEGGISKSKESIISGLFEGKRTGKVFYHEIASLSLVCCHETKYSTETFLFQLYSILCWTSFGYLICSLNITVSKSKILDSPPSFTFQLRAPRSTWLYKTKIYILILYYCSLFSHIHIFHQI